MHLLNLPAFSGAVVVALLLADLVVLGLFFVAAGPVFISGRDAFGRPLETIGVVRRTLLAIVALGVAAYLTVQVSLLLRFLPYFLDPADMATERVTATLAWPNEENPVAYWITTETHRFGVSQEIWRNLAAGDTVRFRYRAADDTLYEIWIEDRVTIPGHPTD